MFRDDDIALIRTALDSADPRMKGITLDTLLEMGWQRLNLPKPFLPFAEGNYPSPSGKCEFYSERLKEMGLDPLPTFTPPYEFPEEVPELAARFPLTLISSPAHHFLNTTFVNVPALRRAVGEPTCLIHPLDAAPRGIETGMRVHIRNDRGGFVVSANVSDSVRPGTVWAPSIWWQKFAEDGHNANATTSQLETDMGHGPVFYDNLVEVSPAD